MQPQLRYRSCPRYILIETNELTRLMSKRENCNEQELVQVPGRCDIPPKIGTVISRGVVRRGAKDTVAGEERLEGRQWRDAGGGLKGTRTMELG